MNSVKIDVNKIPSMNISIMYVNYFTVQLKTRLRPMIRYNLLKLTLIKILFILRHVRLF